jgi:hypothetical protein
MIGFRTSPTFSEAFSDSTRQVAHKSACSSTRIEIPLLLGVETPIYFRGSLGVVTMVLEGWCQVCFPAKGLGPDAATTSSSYL